MIKVTITKMKDPSAQKSQRNVYSVNVCTKIASTLKWRSFAKSLDWSKVSAQMTTQNQLVVQNQLTTQNQLAVQNQIVQKTLKNAISVMESRNNASGKTKIWRKNVNFFAKMTQNQLKIQNQLTTVQNQQNHLSTAQQRWEAAISVMESPEYASRKTKIWKNNVNFFAKMMTTQNQLTVQNQQNHQSTAQQRLKAAISVMESRNNASGKTKI